MKDDLAGDLAKDRGGLGGFRYVSAHVGREPWGSRGPRPPPGWRSAERALVATVIRRAPSRTGSAAPLTWAGLGSCAFHFQLVRAALADREASRFGPRGSHFLGATSKTAFCHGIFFRYRV